VAPHPLEVPGLEAQVEVVGEARGHREVGGAVSPELPARGPGKVDGDDADREKGGDDDEREACPRVGPGPRPVRWRHRAAPIRGAYTRPPVWLYRALPDEEGRGWTT
jgi:hypothetical protein